MASNCTQIGTSSALVKETASITWVLDDFVNLTGNDHYESPEFSPPNNSRLSFQFGVWLRASPFFDSVIVYLYHNQMYEKLNLEFEVSIVDSHNKKCYTRLFQCSYDKNFDYCYCFASLVRYSKLIQEENGFIPGNKLTLFCEVKFLKDSTSSENISGVMFDSKINQNYQSLLESGKFSDGNKNFKAHKAILSAQSAVHNMFAVMFDHGDSKESQEGRVEIVDICAEVFEVLLRYIYTGEIVHMKEYAEELFVAADKYQLENLKSLCEQSLHSSLTPESVIKVFFLADMHNSAQLKANCLEYITKHSVEVMKPDTWKVLNQSRPELLMELYQDLAAKSQPFFNP